MSLVNCIHEEFGAFHFILEATSTPNRYKITKFNDFIGVPAGLLLPLKAL
jgi:hypothetical protein